MAIASKAATDAIPETEAAAEAQDGRTIQQYLDETPVWADGTAVGMTPMTRMQWLIWILAAFGKFFEGMVVFMGGVALPLVSKEFSLGAFEHGLVAAAESLSFKDVSGQCRGDGARSAGVASSTAGWVLPMLNRSCDALAMKERPCVHWLVHRSHAASLRRVTSVTWDPMGIRSLIGKPPRPGGCTGRN